MPKTPVGKAITGIALIVVGVFTTNPYVTAMGVNLILGGVAQNIAQNRAGDNKSKERQDPIKINFDGEESPLFLVFGQIRVGGHVSFMGTYGTNNKFLGLGITHSATTKAGCNDITDIFLDSTRIDDTIIDANGDVISGDYAGMVNIQRFVGKDSSAFDTTIADNISYMDETALGKGLARTHIRFEKVADDEAFRKAFPRGVPGISALLQSVCYDPRNDSTNGGSGSERYNNADTWTFSQNPAVIAGTYLIMAQSDGGWGIDPTAIDWTTLSASANRCDEQVSRPDNLGGSVNAARHTCNVILDTGDTCQDNMNKLLSTMDGSLVTGLDGKVKVLVGQYDTPTTTIDEAWLRQEASVNYDTDDNDVYNAVRAHYKEPITGFQSISCVPFTDAGYETIDGRREWRELDLAATTDRYEAQYLCAIEGRKSRHQKTAVLSLNYKGFDIEVWENVTLDLSDLGLSGTFKVVNWRHEVEGPVVTLLEQTSTAWDSAFADYTETIPTAAPGLVSETPPTPTGLTATATADGIDLAWNALGSGEYSEIMVERSTTSGSGFAKIAEARGSFYRDSITDGAKYYYRIRARSAIKKATYSSYSSEVSATAKTVEDGANNRKYFLQALEPDWDTQGPFSKGDVWKRYPVPADMPQVVVVFIYNGNTQEDDWVASSNYTDNTSIGLYSGSFSESFENGITDNWLRTTGSGTSTIESGQGMGVTGGHVWQAVGEDWRYLNQLIPYDPAKLYRIRVRARMTVAPTDPAKDLFYCGVEGVAADGVTLINSAGSNSHDGQHYISAKGVNMGAFALNEWQEFTGFFSGHSTSPTYNADNPFAPSTLYDGVAYFRPLFILNYDDGDGTMQVDYLSIEVMDASDVIINGPMLPYWKRVNNIPRPLINFGDIEHFDKHQDNIPDGPIFGRTRVNWLKSGRALIDLSDVEHVNKQLDYIGDGTTYERVKALALTGGKIDLSKSGVISKTLDYISNTATFNKVGTAYADTTGRIKALFDDVTGVLRTGGYVGEGAKRAQNGLGTDNKVKLDVPTQYVKYGDGTGIEALKPGEAGATKTAETGVNLLGADAPVEFSVTTAASVGAYCRIYLDTVPLTVLGLKVGDTISFGAELKASGGDSIRLTLNFLNTLGTIVGGHATSFFADASFTRHVVENITIPANTFSIFFATDDNFTAAGTVWCREAIFTKGKLCPPYTNPPADGIVNLLPPVYESEYSFTGFQAIGPLLDITAFGIEPGDPITASMDLRVSVSGGEKISIRLRYFDASKTFISNANPDYNDNTGYVRRYLTSIVPANAKYVDLGANFDTASPTAITGYWRRGSLTKGGVVVPYSPQSAHYLGLAGSGVQLGDNRQVRGAGILSYGSVQSDSAVTFTPGQANINAHNASLGGVTVSYDAISGAVTGLSNNTFYVIACQDPGYQGGSPAWSAYDNIYQAQNSGNDTYIAGAGTVPSSGSTSGGGGATCVCVFAFAHPWQRIGGLVVGDVLDGRPGGRRRVRKAYRETAPCVLLITESGAELPCSGSTPFTTKDGRFVNVLDMYREEVLVRRYRLPNWVLNRHWMAVPILRACHALRVPVAWYQSRRWETVVNWKSIGLQEIMAIDVGAESYAAGSDPFVAIISHNMAKPIGLG